MQIPIYKTFKSVAKPKSKCRSGIGFQFHTPGTKENILSRLFLVKIMFLTKNHKFFEIFKKSVFKDSAVRL